MIAGDHFDLPALRRQAGILDGHLRGENRTGPGEIRVKSGLVIQHADLDVLVLRECRSGKTCHQSGAQHQSG